MTIDQIIKAYGTPTRAHRALGYTLQTFRNWRKRGRIPAKDQAYIQWLTDGALKARK